MSQSRKEYHKAWRKQNREKCREYTKRCREKNITEHREKQKAREKKRREKNPEKIKEEKKRYRENLKKDKSRLEKRRAKNREYMREYIKTPKGREVKRINVLRRRKKRFGITNLDYYAGKSCGCQICRSPLVEGKWGVTMDHDHDTGKFRGFLCRHCNAILGFAKDDIKILQKAIRYLQDYKAKNREKEKEEQAPHEVD